MKRKIRAHTGKLNPFDSDFYTSNPRLYGALGRLFPVVGDTYYIGSGALKKLYQIRSIAHLAGTNIYRLTVRLIN